MRARIVIRGQAERWRRRTAFTISAAVHGCVVVWLAASAAMAPAEKPRSIYEQEIRPNLDRLVWYDFKQKLPDVRPSEKGDGRPARAARKFTQPLVAGKRDDSRAPQMIWLPEAPKVEMRRALALPNVLEVAAPKPRRAFTPPTEAKRSPAPPPLLPVAPKLSQAGMVKPLDLHAAMPAPERKRFVAPRAARRPEMAAPMLTEAPKLAVEGAASAAPVEAAAIRPVRAFAAPAQAAKPREAVRLEEAAPSEEAPAPEYATANLAIVGLNPAKTVEAPRPVAAHDAGFSGGPEVRRDGGSGAGASAGMLVIPGLMASGGGKPGLPTLAAALSAPPMSFGGSVPPGGGRRVGPGVRANDPGAAIRVSSAPDPRLDGRAIYTLAIQMANVTSYSGSWLVWFAERAPAPGAVGEVKPPEPLRKVDPKYIVSAMEERVEGTVRLAAVVRRDGRVEQIELLKHLDDRLDKSAEEALSKWIFQPAERNGRPIEIDAVFEIPFRLAPAPKR